MIDTTKPMDERIAAIHQQSKIPMTNDSDTKRVEIIMLKFKEEPQVIDEAISRIINHTHHPFKLTVFDNRLNSANTSRIWNKLVSESTCDYVCIIDSDAYIPTDIDPCWLTRMMESMANGAELVIPMGDNVGGSNKASGPENYPSERPGEGIWSGYCFLFKKAAIDKIGAFNEDFYIYGQDSEWAHRAYKKGASVAFRTDTFVRHLGGYSFKKADAAGTVDREADRQYAASLYRLITRGKL